MPLPPGLGARPLVTPSVVLCVEIMGALGGTALLEGIHHWEWE